MAATTLLTKAISSHIPFHLEVPAAVLPRWRKEVRAYTVWEVRAGEYYRGISQSRPIIFNVVGSEYARAYQLSVLEVLNHPNSPAFFFEGGLLARLALYYGKPGLLARALEGPSAAMTLHGAGHTEYSRGTHRELVSDPEKNILLGQLSPGAPKRRLTISGHQLLSSRRVSNPMMDGGPRIARGGSSNKLSSLKADSSTPKRKEAG